MIVRGIDDPVRSALVGVTVLDATRMLPGAVLARMLLDLGARVIKIESPSGGDPLRSSPPLRDGTGAGFAALLAGAESVALDLARPGGAAALRRLAASADVLVESFRPGTLERWGAGPELLMADNPALIGCSISSFGLEGPSAARVGHDINFVAESGLLSLLPGEGVPRAQLADVSAGLVAGASILAALFRRTRTQEGVWLDRPIAGALAPFLALAWAEADAGGGGLTEDVLSGRCPAYAIYECADGGRIAVGALEQKFWARLAEAVGLADFAGAGLDTGEAGAEASRRLAERLAEHPRDHWLNLAAEQNLPVSPVEDVAAQVGPPYRFGSTRLPAPALGAHTRDVLLQFGLTADEIDAVV